MSVDAFVARYIHQYVDVDGAYGAQCWDLWERYARDVVGVSNISTQYSPNPGYAIGIWDGYAVNGAAPYFDKISATATPQKGDVAIWKWGAYNHEWSHIAIVMEDQGSNVLVFEQNGYPLRSCELQPNIKTGLAGYLRPKNLNQELFTLSQFEELRTWHGQTHEKLNNANAKIDALKADVQANDSLTHHKINALAALVLQIADAVNAGTTVNPTLIAAARNKLGAP